MPLNQSRMRSELSIDADRLRLLNKINTLYTQKSLRLSFQKDGDRFSAAACTNVAIDTSASENNFIFTRPSGSVIKAALAVQDITYTAVTAGAAGNSITITYTNYTAAVAASKVIQDLTYTADTAGTAGNSITVTYVSDGTAGAETVGVVGSAITVHMDATAITGSTATQIKAAVDASMAAAALVNVAISGTGSTVQTAASVQSLASGAAAIGAAGSEVVSVVGSAISVKLQSGVSTATQVAAKIAASAPASALVVAAITGTAGTAQVTAGSANLADGSDTEQYDLDDIYMIKRLRTKKYLIIFNGSSNPAEAV